MNRISALMVGLFFCLPAFGSIRITENSPTRLSFQWDLTSVDTGSYLDAGRQVTGLGFHDANTTLGSAGEPAIPGYSVFAGMPASGEVKITFTPTEVRTIRLSHPLKKHPLNETGVPNVKQEAVFNADWVSVPRYTWFKSMRTVQLVIRPFLASGDGQSVKMLAHGECTIEFPPAAAFGSRQPPATPYQRMLQGLLLNYSVASSWMSPAKKSLAKAADPCPVDYSSNYLHTFAIGDGHSGMNQMTTKENGVLKISGAQVLRLFGVPAGTMMMGEVALYASQKGPLAEAVPGPDAIPAGVQEIPLLRADVNGNGVVDNDDYFLAYVTGLNDWVWDSSRGDFKYSIHPYDDNRHYWLSRKSLSDGASMSVFRQPAGRSDTVNHFLNHVMFGEPARFPSIVSSGIPVDYYVTEYIWQRISPINPLFDLYLDLPHIDLTAPGTITFQVYGDANSSAQATIGSDTLCLQCTRDQVNPVTHWGDQHLRIGFTGSGDDWWQLQTVRVEYREPLAITTDSVLRVFSSNDSGIHSYKLSGANGKVFVFRIPVNESSISLIDSSSAADTRVWRDTGKAGVNYFVCRESGFITLPDQNISVAPQRISSTSGLAVPYLRNLTNQADYLIITSPSFLSEAERLARHKAKCGFKHPGIVSVNDIYTDFAGGNFDPVAIRNFLAFAVRNWQTRDSLDFAVLIGKGHLDYRQIATSQTNFIPPYESGSNAIEDFYACLTPGTGGQPSIALGRIPAQTLAEAAAAVDKIIALEDSATADWGPWRNTMLFVADDDMQSGSHDPISGNDGGHHWSSELCVNAVDTLWPSMDKRKVYLFDYPWNASWEKPEASAAILKNINNGVGFVNFFGHGSPVLWTDEHVLRTGLVPLLHNAKQYPLISSYSCSVAEFDYPNVQSLSEQLLLAPQAGAGATFAATRSVSASGNTTLAQAFYYALFQHGRDTVRKLDTLVQQPLGMAALQAKAQGYSGNSSFFTLFGDPSLQIIPYARTTRVQITDTAGNPLPDVYDTLSDSSRKVIKCKGIKALQPIKICGTTVNPDGTTDASYSSDGQASAQTTFFNPAYLSGRKDGGADTSVRYMEPGAPVFSGRTPVKNGVFQQTILLPRNLAFNTPFPRLVSYSWQGPRLAIGVADSLLFRGTDTSFSSAKDTIGPTIRIRPIYDNTVMKQNPATFVDHITSTLPLKAEVLISDQGGVSVTGTGPDEGLTMEIPGCLAKTNINSKFQFTNGDYRQGSAVVSFEKNSLKTGTYTLNVSAQDLFGNITKVAFSLNVADSGHLPPLDHVFNAPNPMRMGQSTRFFFSPSISTTYDPNYVEPIQYSASIRIYSLSGRLLYTRNNLQNGDSWDGHDQTGYQLPPDVYLYQIAVTYPNGTSVSELQSSQTVKSKVQKLVIYPPKPR